MNTAMQLLPLILLIFIMYFLLIRPQKKREKATNQMRNTLQVGDEIITIGGVCGKIVKVKDETLIIQVGAEKIKFEIMRWAVSKVVNNDPNASTKKESNLFFYGYVFMNKKNTLIIREKRHEFRS